MLGSYIPVMVMMIAAAVVAGGMVIASSVLGPKHPNRFKDASYECGITPVGSARERFPIKFYLIAMLFIIFDIETIFLYPWAVVFNGVYAHSRAMKFFLLGEMGVFVAILFIGYFYIWGKGALDWDEGQAEGQPAVDKKIFKPRMPIRFGNESTAPVRLSTGARPAVSPMDVRRGTETQKSEAFAGSVGRAD
jgi:NADH-quinone oxidoreductase subunit A